MMNLSNNLKISSAVLIGSNLLLIYGVLSLGFSLFTLMLVYWFENVVIGFFNVLKMLLAEEKEDIEKMSEEEKQKLNEDIKRHMTLVNQFLPNKHLKIPEFNLEKQKKKHGKTGTIIFFISHYGIFTFVHGAFVFAIFSGFGFDLFGVLYGAIAVIMSHGASFAINYIANKEYEYKKATDLFSEPYSRIAVLHLGIMIGAILLMAMDSSLLFLAMFAILKTIADLGVHIFEHKKHAT